MDVRARESLLNSVINLSRIEQAVGPSPHPQRGGRLDLDDTKGGLSIIFLYSVAAASFSSAASLSR